MISFIEAKIQRQIKTQLTTKRKAGTDQGKMTIEEEVFPEKTSYASKLASHSSMKTIIE